MNKLAIIISIFLTFSTFADTQRISVADDSDKKALAEALRINEDLHMAFFKYNAQSVSKYSKKLGEKLAQIKDKKIIKELGRSVKQLSKISEKKSQDQNNKLYSLVSKSMISIIKKYDTGKDYNVYSCPMVKMSWIQNSRKINKVHNPYASYMPHCGTKDTNF